MKWHLWLRISSCSSIPRSIKADRSKFLAFKGYDKGDLSTKGYITAHQIPGIKDHPRSVVHQQCGKAKKRLFLFEKYWYGVKENWGTFDPPEATGTNLKDIDVGKKNIFVFQKVWSTWSHKNHWQRLKSLLTSTAIILIQCTELCRSLKQRNIEE